MVRWLRNMVPTDLPLESNMNFPDDNLDQTCRSTPSLTIGTPGASPSEVFHRPWIRAFPGLRAAAVAATAEAVAQPIEFD